MATDPYKYFLTEARELVEQIGRSLLDLEGKDGAGDALSRLLRATHTLKGAARVVRLPAIANDAHELETLLAPFRDASGSVDEALIQQSLQLADSITMRIGALSRPLATADDRNEPEATAPNPLWAIRDNVAETSEIIEGLADLHGHFPMLAEVVALTERAHVLCDLMAAERPLDAVNWTHQRSDAEELKAHLTMIRGQLDKFHERCDHDLRRIRDTAEQLRLFPVRLFFGGLERAVRDSARALGRRAVFRASGGGIRIDAAVGQVIQDILHQLVRNAVVHGIEPAEARIAAGKPEVGSVSLEVVRRGREVVFRCRDDGRGIDFAAVEQAAIRKGMLSDGAIAPTAGQLTEILLRGGMSTAANVTEVSGRGIGLEIVGAGMRALGGRTTVRTNPGEGTLFEVAVPVSLSMVDVVSVVSGTAKVMLPAADVETTLRLAGGDILRAQGDEVILVQERITPFAHLSRFLGEPDPLDGSHVSTIVLRTNDGRRAAFGVDRLLGVSAVLLEAMPELALASPIVAGASRDADGLPVFLLDTDQLIQRAMADDVRASPDVARGGRVLVIDDSLTARMLEKSILETAGYVVDTAASAREALERMGLSPYHMVLVDIEMPEMDGIAFIETIRKDSRLKDVPAILVTSLDSDEHRHRGFAAGAQGYFVKSEFDQNRLLARIRELGVLP